MNRRPFLARFVASLAVAVSIMAAGCRDSRQSTTVREAPPSAVAASEIAPAVDGTATATRIASVPAPASDMQSPEPAVALAMAHVKTLSVDIGIRPSGTEKEHEAAEYLAGQLRSYGYEVEMQRFPVEAFNIRTTSFTLDAPATQRVTVQPITGSRAGTASGALLFAGIGREGDFPAAVKGQIALVQRGEISFHDKAANALGAGARAIVIFNTEDDLLSGAMREPQSEIPALPVLAISGVDGRRLRDQITGGPVRATVSFDGGVEASDSMNVIGRQPGARCHVLIGGHYDSVPGAPAANDNATGTAAVLEMARVTALRGNPRQACFAGFASEEIGLVGSDYFVKHLAPEERQTLSFMLNFDMVAFGTEWLTIGTPALQSQGNSIDAEIGVSSRSVQLVGASSDHASFITGGIPALMLHRSDDPLLHTPEDVIDRISPEQLDQAVRIGLVWLSGINPS